MNPVFFSSHLPSLKKVFSSAGPNVRQALVVCDRKFQTQPLLKKWRDCKSLQFYYLSSGEKSKSLERLSVHVKNILALNRDFDKNAFAFISFGGGSVIDLTGFLASIYKRGLPVIHFPTTWLSALDSAHGGKTAINFLNVKNLLGTYHFPKAVFIVKNILKQAPAHLSNQAWGELLKIAFIEGGSFYTSLKKEHHSLMCSVSKKNNLKEKTKLYCSFLEFFLKPAIQAKMKVVQRDPLEDKNIRKTLNLGHTVGHILESLYPLSHGEAVLQGLLFSLNWSFHRALLSRKMFEEMRSLIFFKQAGKKLSSSLFKKHLRQDKKHKQNYKLDFIFIKRPGLVFVKSVSEKELLTEAKRQNLI